MSKTIAFSIGLISVGLVLFITGYAIGIRLQDEPINNSIGGTGWDSATATWE